MLKKRGKDRTQAFKIDNLLQHCYNEICISAHTPPNTSCRPACPHNVCCCFICQGFLNNTLPYCVTLFSFRLHCRMCCAKAIYQNKCIPPFHAPSFSFLTLISGWFVMWTLFFRKTPIALLVKSVVVGKEAGTCVPM